MRALRYLIPDDIRDSLNANPVGKWLAITMIVVIGIALFAVGVNGIKEKRISGKNGKVYEGRKAQVLGVLYVLTGASMSLSALAMGFAS